MENHVLKEENKEIFNKVSQKSLQKYKQRRKSMSKRILQARKKSVKGALKERRKSKNTSLSLEQGRSPCDNFSNNFTENPNSMREIHNMYEYMFMPELKR